MAHNIETNGSQAAFLSARQDAWHRLGITLPDTFTAEQAMEEGYLGGWNLRKEPIQTETGIIIHGKNGVVRDNPFTGVAEALGVVGDSYTLVQNEEHAEFLNALVDESGAHFETAGSIDGGRKVFITMKMPQHLTVGGSDLVEHHIAAINSHDGSMAFTLLVTPVRIVCQNTLNVALSQNKSIHRIRHTKGATKAVAQARESLNLVFKYIDGFQEEADRLINTSLTEAEFVSIIEREFGAPENAAPGTVSRASNRMDQMVELFVEANTQEGIRDTAWAGFNALTEWFDHFSPTRGGDPDQLRAVNAVLSPDFKQKALSLFAS